MDLLLLFGLIFAWFYFSGGDSKKQQKEVTELKYAVARLEGTIHKIAREMQITDAATNRELDAIDQSFKAHDKILLDMATILKEKKHG